MTLGAQIQPATYAVPTGLPADLVRESIVSLGTLRQLLDAGPREGLVFLVGAGGSAGRFPTASTLLGSTLAEAARYVWKRGPAGPRVASGLVVARERIGFEVSMNEFASVCDGAVETLMRSLARAEDSGTVPGPAHRLLAAWVRAGGHVLTVNYDRLIERADPMGTLAVRYAREDRDAPFMAWRDDLVGGGTLFKLHGSLADPEGCLAALRDVTTRLTGPRAELLTAVVTERPLCVLGWSARDPDVPPVLVDALAARPADLPLIWVHHVRGSEWAAPSGMDAKRHRVAELTGGHPSVRHLFTDLPRLIRGDWSEMADLDVDAAEWVRQCTPTGAARYLAATLRRLGSWSDAMDAAHLAERLATTASERSAARQERAATLYARGRHRTAMRVMASPASMTVDAGDHESRVTYAFGRASMAVSLAIRGPSGDHAAAGPALLDYARAVRTWGKAASSERDRSSVALHEALLATQIARTRLARRRRAGPARRGGARLLALHAHARRRIADAGDIHLHSAIDVAVAAGQAEAELGLRPAVDIAEIERQLRILADVARTRHWAERQMPALVHTTAKGPPES